jgi:hypothetical protein
MSDAPTLSKPVRGSSAYDTCLSMCHMRLAALYRIAGGRQEPDDAKLVTGTESLLAMRGCTPRDFGFVDPPQFAAALRVVARSIEYGSPEAQARAIWQIPAGQRVVY